MARLPGPGLLTLLRISPRALKHPADVATELRARYGVRVVVESVRAPSGRESQSHGV